MYEQYKERIADIIKARKRSVRLLAFFSTPFGLGFVYVLFNALPEIKSEDLGFGIYFGFAIIAVSILAFFYLWVSFFKLKTLAKKGKAFKFETNHGTPIFKESFFAYRMHTDTGTLSTPPPRRRKFMGELNGIKYNFWIFSTSAVTSGPLKITAITHKSPWLGSNFEHFVISAAKEQ